MPYFRVYCENYIEGEFEDVEEAKQEYVNWLKDMFDPDFNLVIEKFNKREGHWE